MSCVCVMLLNGCSFFPEKELEKPVPGIVAQLRLQEIQKDGRFRCFLAEHTSESIRIFLTQSVRKNGLTPSFRVVRTKDIPAYLRAGYADVGYIHDPDAEAERYGLHGIPVKIGGVKSGTLLLRGDDPDWETLWRQVLSDEIREDPLRK